jgi:phosphate acetyltransferase
MDLLLELREKARRARRRIVLPEARDPRVRQAAARLASEGLCTPVLVDTGGVGTLPAGVEVVRPASDKRIPRLVEELLELRRAKGMTAQEAAKRVLDANTFGALLVREGTATAASAAASPPPPTSCGRACR